MNKKILYKNKVTILTFLPSYIYFWSKKIWIHIFAIILINSLVLIKIRCKLNSFTVIDLTGKSTRWMPHNSKKNFMLISHFLRKPGTMNICNFWEVTPLKFADLIFFSWDIFHKRETKDKFEKYHLVFKSWSFVCFERLFFFWIILQLRHFIRDKLKTSTYQFL